MFENDYALRLRHKAQHIQCLGGACEKAHIMLYNVVLRLSDVIKMLAGAARNKQTNKRTNKHILNQKQSQQQAG